MLFSHSGSRGRHRKVTTSESFKGRVALVTVAAGTVSAAGAGGAAAATLQAAPEKVDVDIEKTSDAEALSAEPVSETPQVLAIAEHKPVAGLADQLDKAVAAVEEREAAEAAAAAAEAAAAAAAAAEGLSSSSAGDILNPLNAAVVKPTEGVFTSGFGPRWGTIHKGIDIANAIGTPILAIMDGTVIDAGPASGYGNWIRIKHDDGSISIYGHMVSLNVSVGDRVSAGQNIAGMGNEGFSTGSHLHFEIHPTGNGAVDPVPWFAERGITIQ
ncbi:endopeptidase [Corynebacterium yudongzhengii]|uniref:M23 family peptidase n=1 Tax=Corynebacterium yudongzhengii TaxID=2080740 RepID=A0A2U1T5G7_9CORY|nr:M23 family metallopeptidase [Corynebacterium yudongzhengii]AWB81009.1 endopeptidase [Corynebacterium yudongzhengii]PWC01254.1 M23 family peptidase [Corynebacterium yudongzhengii]